MSKYFIFEEHDADLWLLGTTSDLPPSDAVVVDKKFPESIFLGQYMFCYSYGNLLWVEVGQRGRHDPAAVESYVDRT